jgi:kynurenine formamidase
MRVVDLTRPMTEETLVALGGRKTVEGWMVEPVDIQWLRSWQRGDNTTQCTWHLSDHFGTHVDAPVHVIEGTAGVDGMDLSRLVGDAVVLDCRFARGRGITAADLDRAAPQPRPGDIVLLCVAEPAGTVADYLVDQTYVTVEGARWLVDHGVHAVGVETACFEHSYQRSIVERCYEPTEPDPWPAHRICLERDVYIIEGLTGLEAIVGERVHFAAAPLPVPGSSGSPVRAFAWRP